MRGGTWLAFQRGDRPGAFKFSVVHNFRHAGVLVPDARSRGDLPTNFVRADVSAADYAYSVEAAAYEYNGFTLVVVDQDDAYFVSNRPRQVRHLEPGFYALSNASLDAPWPKLVLGKSTFTRLLATHLEEPELSDRQLSRVLADAVLRNAALFPHDLPGILAPGREVALSSVFVAPYEWDDSGMYGTRTHSLVFVHPDGSAFLAEHNLEAHEFQSAAYLARDRRDAAKPPLIPDADEVLARAKQIGSAASRAIGQEAVRGRWRVREFDLPPWDALARL